MKHLLSLGLGCVCLGWISSASAANLFDLTLRRFATSVQGPSCADRIANVAASFEQSSGADVITARCVPSELDAQELTGVITYSSDVRMAIPPVMSPFGDGLDDYGHYLTEAGCEADRERQVTLFTTATGLAPFASYCYRVGSLNPFFGVQIIAVGTSDIGRFISKIDYAAPTSGMLNQIRNRLTALGATVIDVGIGNRIHKEIRMDYYASEQFHIKVDQSIKFESASVCQAELGRLSSELFAGSLQNISNYCVGSTLNIVNAIPIGGNWDGNYKILTMNDQYIDRLSCNFALAQHQDDLESRGLEVISTVCGLLNGHFSAHAFVKLNP